MADEPKAVKESADTPEPMPSSKETPSDPKVSSQEVDPKVEKEEIQLPDDTKKRTTEQFDKLREQLKTEREGRLRLERTYQRLGVPTQQSPTPDYYDPATGTVDVNKLHQKVTQAERMAQQAIQATKGIIADSDREQEVTAYKAHPDLDPRADGGEKFGGVKFNEDLHKATLGYLATQFAEGKSMTLKQAADKVKSFSKVELKKAEEEGAKKALSDLTPKEQASLEAVGRSDRRKDTADLGDLRVKTRHGDESALQKRLKNIPIV